MDYSDLDKQALSLMEKIKLKNLSKSDMLSFTSKLNEMTPELAKLFLANYPELIKLIQNMSTSKSPSRHKTRQNMKN